MPNAQVFATIEGSGECLIISISAAGAFSLAKGKFPDPNDASIVPITCDIIGSGTEYIIDRRANNSHVKNVKKRPSNDRSVVPLVGRAAGPVRSININATSGAITAGSFSTTVASLFP